MGGGSGQMATQLSLLTSQEILSMLSRFDWVCSGFHQFQFRHVYFYQGEAGHKPTVIKLRVVKIIHAF